MGPISELNSLKIDYNEIYIAIPSANRKQLRRIVDLCKKTNNPFKTLSKSFDNHLKYVENQLKPISTMWKTISNMLEIIQNG